MTKKGWTSRATAEGKHCSKCDQFKPYAEYYRQISNTTGYMPRCRVCHLAEQRERNRIRSNRQGVPTSPVKRCTGCGVEQTVAAFSRDRRSEDGLAAQCKACRYKAHCRWRQANSDHVREYSRRYREQNAETLRQYRRRWGEANRDRLRELDRLWRQQNPERAREIRRRNRALRPDLARASEQRWKGKNPGRVAMAARAYNHVQKALRDGRLVRPSTCETCSASGVRIDAAHDDYAKPLDVKWLCRICHRFWDMAKPKTLPIRRRDLEA